MKFAYLFPLFAVFSSPIFAGQVAVINPGGIVSVTVAPAPPSNVVAPPALTGAPAPATPNAGRAATNVLGSPQLKGNMQAIDMLVANVEVSRFTPAQIKELLSKIERALFNDVLSSTRTEILRREYERLSALNVEY